MKKKKISGKLVLKRSTVVNLSIGERRAVKGGEDTEGFYPTCWGVTCEGTCGEITCLGTNCDTFYECGPSDSCLHMCVTEKLYPTCNPMHC